MNAGYNAGKNLD